VGEHLPSKLKALSSNFSTLKKENNNKDNWKTPNSLKLSNTLLNNP
jgi:hypothetical protein